MQLPIDMQTVTAFLHMQMMTTAIYGVPIAPAGLADEKGNAVVVQQVASIHRLEHMLRPVSYLSPCLTQSLSQFPILDILLDVLQCPPLQLNTHTCTNFTLCLPGSMCRKTSSKNQ